MTDQLDRLLEAINPEVSEAITVIRSKPGKDNPYLVEVPETFYIDSVREDVESLIARCANAFSRLSRLTGLVHALWKATEIQYDISWAKAYKQAEGSNQKARESEATIATEEVARKAAAYEAYYRIMERHAHAAEVASESARKIATKIFDMHVGEIREGKGKFKESDFSS